MFCRRGAVESFKFLAASHPYIADIIEGKTVVFGRSSGVSLSGHIILYSGEVLNELKGTLNFARWQSFRVTDHSFGPRPPKIGM